MTIQRTLEAVGGDLAKDGITLVLSTTDKTTGDAWCDATERHGERVALVHLPEGLWFHGRPHYRTRDDYAPASILYVSYPWDDVEAGKRIYDALAGCGFTVEWDGDGTRAIQIHLDH